MQNVDLALSFILEGGMQPALTSSKSKSHFSRSAQVLPGSLSFTFSLSTSCVLKKQFSLQPVCTLPAAQCMHLIHKTHVNTYKHRC